MHERIRAQGRFRVNLPTSEAWHDLSRFVAITKGSSARRPAGAPDGEPGDRNG